MWYFKEYHKDRMKKKLCFALAFVLLWSTMMPGSAALQADCIEPEILWMQHHHYENAEPFSDGMALVKAGSYPYERFGFVDHTGKEVVPLKYGYAFSFREGLASVALYDKWGYVDKGGKEVVSLHFDSVNRFSDGLAPVCSSEGKWGYIDAAGKERIPFKYDTADSFQEGLACVSQNGKFGFIDPTGKEAVPLKYDYATEFRDGLAQVRNDAANGTSVCGFVDKTGKEVIPLKYESLSDFHDGLAAFSAYGAWGFLDKTGKELVPASYDQVADFSDGLAAVKSLGRWGFIDKAGQVVIPMQYDDVDGFSGFYFHEGLASVRWYGKWGYIDKAGRQMTPFKYEEAGDFHEGLAVVGWGWYPFYLKYGLIDKTGKEFIPLKYDYLSDFSEGLAIVKINGAWGVMKNPLYTQAAGMKPSCLKEGEVFARYSKAKLSVDGQEARALELYNIEDNSYVKLRDVAKLMEASSKAFSVDWNKEKKLISLNLGAKYQEIGGELASGDGMYKIGVLSKAKVELDGRVLGLKAYSIHGNNYFKLRDLADAFGIQVDWDKKTKTILLNTK